MSSDAALLQEIQRLSGAIDRHKSHEAKPAYAPRFHQESSYPVVTHRKYVNPAIAHKKYVNPASKPQPSSGSGNSSDSTHATATRDLVIDGVAFESSSRKLTRKDLITNKLGSTSSSSISNSTERFSTYSTMSRARGPYVRRGGNLVSSNRIHKPKYTKGKRPGGHNNMVLDNVKGTRSGNMSKRRKMDKQCRFFTMTGVCQRGLTCPYQHDPEKIAICPQFLTHNCPNSADSCHLSHDPTPSRVPFCHHFANHGRCTRDDCPYPHVRVGPRNGVCRDFAVVGYCDKGIDCDKQHVRECPDFAEKGICPNRACKLPHVIRANRRRQPVTSSNQENQTQVQDEGTGLRKSQTAIAEEEYISTSSSAVPLVLPSTGSAEPGGAEEYISLTFEESDDEEENEDDDDDDEENDSAEDQDSESNHEERITDDNEE